MAKDVKTLPHDGDVDSFVAAVENPVRRRDAERLVALMERVTGQPARMWGPTIIGFGTYHYEYASGRSGDAAGAGFSPRKAATTVYFPDGFARRGEILDRLGPHTIGAACLYLKDLDAVDMAVLEEMVRDSYATVTAGTFGQRLS